MNDCFSQAIRSSFHSIDNHFSSFVLLIEGVQSLLLTNDVLLGANKHCLQLHTHQQHNYVIVWLGKKSGSLLDNASNYLVGYIIQKRSKQLGPYNATNDLSIYIFFLIRIYRTIKSQAGKKEGTKVLASDFCNVRLSKGKVIYYYYI